MCSCCFAETSVTSWKGGDRHSVVQVENCLKTGNKGGYQSTNCLLCRKQCYFKEWMWWQLCNASIEWFKNTHNKDGYKEKKAVPLCICLVSMLLLHVNISSIQPSFLELTPDILQSFSIFFKFAWLVTGPQMEMANALLRES